MANNAAVSSLDDLFEDDELVQAPPAPKAAKKTQADAEEKPAPKATAPKGATSHSSIAAQAAVKLQQIEKEMNSLFVERESEIKSLIIGLISGWHVMLLGAPGTGKSAMTREFCSRVVGGNHFELLMNQTTDPSELLGPFSLTALKNDSFMRNVSGKLPEAHTAFIDEIYKSNSAALNILLPMLNEGIYFNDGKKFEAALQFAVGASNEEPQDESLAAFHDRFPFRHWVDYVRDAGNKAKMLRLNIDRNNPNVPFAASKTTISLQEIEAIRNAAHQVTVDNSVISEFQKLIFELEKKGLVISDRRQATCFELAQAHAALEGRKALLTDDFCVLIPVLWQRKDDIQAVETEVLKLANPFEEKLRRIMDQAREAYDKTMSVVKPADKANAAIDARDQFAKAIKNIDKIIKEAMAQGRDTTKMDAAKQQVVGMNQEVIDKCLMMTGNSGSDDGDDGDMPF